MKLRRTGKTSTIPTSFIISDDLLYRILASSFSKNKNFKSFINRLLSKLGLQVNEREKIIKNINYSNIDGKDVFNSLTDVFYDIFSMGSGFKLLKREDCNVSMRGERTEKQVFDNSLIGNTKKKFKYTVINPFLKVKTRSTSPSSLKELTNKKPK